MDLDLQLHIFLVNGGALGAMTAAIPVGAALYGEWLFVWLVPLHIMHSKNN
ncbi:hypothetical protein ACFSN5_07160 [Streptococcus tangpeifui]|uniref:hypothetical protein n=1 Tax=Streptococcus tangpeifui TaxID=2709400 RepID=UPI001F153531|nr:MULTISPECIES: hypothetical protein [unclassified Streptococcus]